MKTLLCGLSLSFAFGAAAVAAEETLSVDGQVFTLSELMATCQALADDPVAQIGCFNDISRLLEEQANAPQEPAITVPEALDALRSVAQYQDDASGLTIAGTDCNIQILYYTNYFHISRRNISTIDLFGAAFDASKVRFDTLAAVQGAQAPLTRAALDAGAVATMQGGVAMESAQFGFAPISPGMSLDAYANDVVGQLPVREGETFEFVLVHPALGASSADIWTAFETLVTTCRP